MERQWIPYPDGREFGSITNYPGSRGLEIIWGSSNHKTLSIREQLLILFNTETEKMRNEMERRLRAFGL